MKNYNEFENKMKQKGYEIFKARGIAFWDKQKVYTKGSEVGYSLQTIEKILALKPELAQTFLKQKELCVFSFSVVPINSFVVIFRVDQLFQ